MDPRSYLGQLTSNPIDSMRATEEKKLVTTNSNESPDYLSITEIPMSSCEDAVRCGVDVVPKFVRFFVVLGRPTSRFEARKLDPLKKHDL